MSSIALAFNSETSTTSIPQRVVHRLRALHPIPLLPLAAVAIFLIDLAVPRGVAMGTLHCLVILLAIGSPTRQLLWGSAVLCSCLIVLGWWLSPSIAHEFSSVPDRLISLGVLWLTALLGDQLAGRTYVLRMQADRQTELIREIDHRVRNNLAGLMALIDELERERPASAESLPRLRRRIIAMLTAQRLLSRSSWRGVELPALVEAVRQNFGAGAIQLDGPAVRIPSRQTPALAMVLSELASNAHEHGAWREPRGSVSVEWKVKDSPRPGARNVSLIWREMGGPGVPIPPRMRMGANLIEGFVSHELRGSVRLNFDETGCRHEFEFAVEAEPNA